MAERRGVDSELDFKAIFVSVAVLCGVTVAAFALVWGIAVLQKKRLVARDAPPPVLAEARVPVVPAGPLLQADPETDLALLRAREDVVLTGWSWADAAKTRARVPAARALEIVAERGFPPRTPGSRPEVKK